MYDFNSGTFPADFPELFNICQQTLQHKTCFQVLLYPFSDKEN